MSLAEEKVHVRDEMTRRRAALAADYRQLQSGLLATFDLARVFQRSDAIVSGFLSFRDEIDTGPLLARLTRDGHRLCLPVIKGHERPLLFRAWKPSDELVPAQWGIREPTADKPLVEPDILLVPLLAFDAAGNRLGYGAGYYDRTIDALRAKKSIITIGIAYDEQRVDAVPHSDYDQRLDWVLTPSGPLRCPSSRES